MTYWNVMVFGGVQPTPEQQAEAPIHFGTPEVILGGDGSLREPHIPLEYGPVTIETMSPGTVSMCEGEAWVHNSKHALHVMENVWHVYFGLGCVEIEGVEMRGDGVMVHSRWEATPTDPPEADRRLIEEMFGEPPRGLEDRPPPAT